MCYVCTHLHIYVDKALRNAFLVHGSDHYWCVVWIMVSTFCLVVHHTVCHMIIHPGDFNHIEHQMAFIKTISLILMVGV